MLVGNYGSKYRFNYSVLGDQVNLASRLEQLGKTYGTEIMIGEGTADLSAATSCCASSTACGSRGASRRCGSTSFWAWPAPRCLPSGRRC